MAPSKVTFIYSNLVTDQGLITVSSETGQFEKKYLIDSQYSTAWRSDGVAECTITLDFTQIVTVDCIALGNHNLYGEVTSFKIYHSTDGATWTEFASVAVDLTEKDFVYFFSVSTSKRYWRLVFSGATNITFYEIGELWFARYTELTNNPLLPVDNWEEEHFIHSKETSGGQEHTYKLYDRIYWTLNFGAYNTETNQAKLRALWAVAGKDMPFWCWLDPIDIDTLKYCKIDAFKFDKSIGSSYPGSLTLKSAL